MFTIILEDDFVAEDISQRRKVIPICLKSANNFKNCL